MSSHVRFEKISTDEVYEEKHFKWKISNFSKIFKKKYCMLRKSKHFHFAGDVFRFKLNPIKVFDRKYITLSLQRLKAHEPVQYSIGLKNIHNHIETLTDEVLTRDCSQTVACFLALSEIEPRTAEITPFDVLTITCRLRRGTALFIEPQEMPIAISKQLSKNETLQDHFRRAFLEGENHDLIIKVGEREFQVHRDILRARSPVFNAMLSYETDERTSGIVNIPDCDPSIMELFLLYVYCGEIEDRNETNMIHLYYLADKYDMADLKNVCHNFINRSLSNTNFFEIIELAMFHNDSNLLEYAAEHFINNSQAIVKTEQWQFLRENNRALTDDLLMKYFARIGPLGYEDPLSLYMQTFHYQV